MTKIDRNPNNRDLVSELFQVDTESSRAMARILLKVKYKSDMPQKSKFTKRPKQRYSDMVLDIMYDILLILSDEKPKKAKDVVDEMDEKYELTDDGSKVFRIFHNMAANQLAKPYSLKSNGNVEWWIIHPTALGLSFDEMVERVNSNSEVFNKSLRT